MRQEIRNLVNITNPWLSHKDTWKEAVEKRLPSFFIERTFLDLMSKRWQESDRIHLVVGPRQSGKSTAIWKYLSETNGRVLFINCEEPLFRDWCRSSALFCEDLKDLLPEIDYLFFDEAQRLDDAGLFLKGIADLKISKSIIVTGSSSYHLHAKTRESLAGRATRTMVTPLTFKELIPMRKKGDEWSWREKIKKIIEAELSYGSYPGVWLSDKREDELFGLIESFVIRDASDLFRIKHVEAFRQMLKLISFQIGSLVNYSEWASIVGIDNVTLKNYINILQETGIVYIIEPFAGGKRSEITSSPNIYFVDVGVRNACMGQYMSIDERSDRGPLFENWAVSELRKMLSQDVSLRFWRSKSGSEVDIVLQKGKRLVGIEVKFAKYSQAKISRSSRSFIEAYQPTHFFVVNRGYEGECDVAGCNVSHILPEDLLKIIECMEE